MIDIYVGKQRHAVDPDKPLGAGGEARIFNLGNGQVAKVYYDESDPALGNDPAAQHAARRRIDTHQKKLPEFPRGMPAAVVAPTDLVKNRQGRIIGYTMPFVAGGEVLLRYSLPKPRQGIPQADVLPMLRELRAAVEAVHRLGVVIGDFNDANVLVVGGGVRLIDADSFQYGPYACSTYTTKFVDPRNCTADPKTGAPVMARPHTSDSDWYAFLVMLMGTFLFAGPYDGVYTPPPGTPKVLHCARQMARVTVWSSGVMYPRPAVPWSVLPDDLLGRLQDTFVRDVRGPVPASLLDNLRWTTCSCGLEHARASCPKVGCGTTALAVAPVTQVVAVRGNVTATVIYQARGHLVRVERQGGNLLWLAHVDDGRGDGGVLRRDDGTSIARGPLDRAMRFRCAKGRTMLALGSRVLELTHGAAEPTLDVEVDTMDGAPVFQVAGDKTFWCADDALWRSADVTHGKLSTGPVRIGSVLGGQTRFWVGARFGFGFYRVGAMTMAFVFDVDGRVKDGVKTPVVGTVLDATVVFDDHDHAWFFTTTQEGARRVNRCRVVKRDGTVVASAEADAGDGSWLGVIRGGAAIPGATGTMLLAPTDTGVVRLEPQAGDAIAVTRTFPDTEQWVDQGCRLVMAGGIHVVSADGRRITKLEIRP